MSREAKIAAAATFLSDPATASAPLGAKMQYLRKQHGLTQAEVEQEPEDHGQERHKVPRGTKAHHM